MTSSMLTGERRWASARRGGMTIIGKVAVPKPINLPSQRLENHGLNPNVEIVPKGTLSWGSRSSSSASNAWGSSTLSPTTDGGTASPSHLSGRPSSGGSGTRPSTAGSDRAPEHTSNAWGPSSRPSSASGALTSNQTSVTSLRPRSAETRPSSSQLSRFAESSENSVAWGGSGTAERLGVTLPKNDGFSLSSGDFPTLGSEKDGVTKSTDSQEHGTHSRPGSSSSGAPLVRERSGASPTGDVSPNSVVKSGNVNTWRRDNGPHDGFRPNVEKWQGEPQPYQNANMPPQAFGPWHGNPAPGGGVWYRGPPSGPPYGTPVPPGGFPMEYPYYHAQIPATGLPNSQPVPPPGVGPRGPHPQTGDMYRPHIPDAYIRPGMPVRPGFYHGPVAYEGYYAPPMGYCNTNERDIPFMGMPPGPSVYNRYTSQTAPDPSQSQAGPGGYGSTGKPLVSEQMESGHPQDPRGQYKVLLKHRNGWDGKEEEQKWEHAAPNNASHFEKGDQPRTTSRENNWRPDYKKDEHMETRRMAVGQEAAPQSSDFLGEVSVPGKVKVVDEHMVKESHIDVPASPKNLATPKDTTLIQKIEGLNAKARASDGKHDVTYVSGREEQKSKLHVVNAKVVHPTKEVSSGALGHGRILTTGVISPASFDVGVATGDRGLEMAAISGTSLPRKAIHGAQGRVDHRGKGRVNTQEADGWQKKPIVAVAPSAVSALNSETANVHLQDHHISEEVTEKSGSYLEGKDDGESVTSMSDPSDIQAQRAKMREIAKQRAKQLQKEEEERTREQKAKALAKLEELNRRTLAVEGSTQKLENLPPDEPTIGTSKTEAPNSALVCNYSVATHNSESSSSRVGESAILSREPPIEAPKNTSQVSVVTHNPSLPLQQDVDNVVAAEIAPQHLDSSVPKQKRTSYKQKPKTPLEKSSIEKSNISANEAPKSQNEVSINVDASTEVVTDIASGCESSLSVNPNVTESSLPVNPNFMPEPSVPQRRKNYRNGRNKHKQEETTAVVAIPSLVPKDANIAKASVESGKPKPSEWEMDPMPVMSMTTSSKDAVQSLEQHSSLLSEESHGRVNNQWKSHNPRKLPRNQQVNRSVDKFHGGDAVVWAPVRSQNKSEVNDEASHKTVLDEDVTLTTRSDNTVQNNSRNKRAEMERYVPKPVAKELAQQGCIQQPMSPSSNQISSDETVGRDESGSQSAGNTQPAGMVVGKIGSSTGSRNGDSKQNKQTKAHGSWRQRGSTESARVQVVQDGSSFSSKPSKDVQESLEHNQLMKPDVQSVKVQAQSSDEWTDGWHIPDYSDSAASIASPVVKDQGFPGKGKRHPYKGHRVTGNNSNYEIDHKNTNSGNKDRVYPQSSALETNETDKTVASKDNRGVGERSTSQWQPKSQAYTSHNQRGSRPSGSQNVTAEVGRFVKKDSTPKGGVHPSSKNEEIGDSMNHSHLEHSMSKTVGEAPNVGHQDAKREKKATPLQGRPHSPNQGSLSLVESAPNEDLGPRYEQQRFSSGFRKNGNQNNRFGSGHESRRDWSSTGQDSKQHKQPANRDRQRHNSEYEYQPIGSYNSNKSNNFEGPADGSSRLRERGQTHSRRGGGNFYGRQSGTVGVDAAYD